MALHELATNAAKPGALSNGEGQVRISWHVDVAKQQTFSMSWLEEGHPESESAPPQGLARSSSDVWQRRRSTAPPRSTIAPWVILEIERTFR